LTGLLLGQAPALAVSVATSNQRLLLARFC